MVHFISELEHNFKRYFISVATECDRYIRYNEISKRVILYFVFMGNKNKYKQTIYKIYKIQLGGIARDQNIFSG